MACRAQRSIDSANRRFRTLALAFSTVVLVGCGGASDPSTAAFEPLAFPTGFEGVSAQAISGDGRVVVGVGWPYTFMGHRWTVVLRWLGSDVESLSIPGWWKPILSRDGSVLVDRRTVAIHVLPLQYVLEESEPYIWSESRGIHPFPWDPPSLAELHVTAMNPDASMFAGTFVDEARGAVVAFRANGAAVEVLPDPENGYAIPSGMSADGSVVAGYIARPPSSTGTNRAIRWVDGEQSFYQPVDGLEDCGPGRLSDDGVFTIGNCTGNDGGSAHTFAVLWRGVAGTMLTRAPGEASSSAEDLSSDASVIVGQLRIGDVYDAFVWTEREGKRLLKDLLTEAGLGEAIEGWKLRNAESVSDDGRVIAGTGVDPTGRTAGFRAVLP